MTTTTRDYTWLHLTTRDYTWLHVTTRDYTWPLPHYKTATSHLSGTVSNSDDTPADVTFVMKPEVFKKVIKGEIQTTAAFMSGQMKIKGNLMEAMKLESLFKKMRSKL